MFLQCTWHVLGSTEMSACCTLFLEQSDEFVSCELVLVRCDGGDAHRIIVTRRWKIQLDDRLRPTGGGRSYNNTLNTADNPDTIPDTTMVDTMVTMQLGDLWSHGTVLRYFDFCSGETENFRSWTWRHLRWHVLFTTRFSILVARCFDGITQYTEELSVVVAAYSITYNVCIVIWRHRCVLW